MYELIIIGAGPAGITASIYAARKRMNFLVLTKDIGGQAALSSDIENYTGYQYITGRELVERFEQHMREFQIEVRYEEVTGIKRIEGGFEVKTDKGTYRCMALIVATGASPRMLNVPGEREFKNRGVTYCATCDAPLFADKDVAVVGGGNSGLDATLQLMRIANRIYLIELGHELRGDEVMREKVERSEKVTILTDTKVLEILGDRFVRGIVIERGGKREVLKVQGVFIEIGYTPNSDLVAEIVKLNQRGEILIDDRCRTSAEGIFACGDVSSVPQKQIIVAAGEGAKAALSAYEYLQRLKRQP
ncbi:MAG: FAD-dependent oxidoreductase [Hadesarchaea archaeon]|nr:FAD-dependent oxidoreductase [Hadesarchaea archaeon]